MDLTILDSILECSVCLERLRADARVLPCQHTFCLDCLKRVSNKHPQSPLACPECRQQTNLFDIDSLPRNVFLIRLLDQIKPTSNGGETDEQVQASSNDQAVTTNGSEKKPTVRVANDQQTSSIPYAKALFDFHMNPLEDEGCLKFMKGMIIQVTRRVDQNWAEGKINEKVGIFPISFVHMNQAATNLMQSYATKWKLPASMPSMPATNGNSASTSATSPQRFPLLQPTPAQPMLVRPTSPPSATHSQVLPAGAIPAQDKTGIYIALYNYTPQKPDELELKKGSHYIVKEACQDGWFKGLCSDNLFEKGVFPGNHVMPLLYHQKMMTMQRIAALQAQENKTNSNTQQPRTTGAYTNLGLSSVPPELPQRNAPPRAAQSPLSQQTTLSDQSQKTDDNVNRVKKETVTEMLMKRLGYNRKSTESSAYSMDNPVFEDSSAKTSATPQHMRSGSCPIDLGLPKTSLENLQFGSQRVKTRERAPLPMASADGVQKRHSINLTGPPSTSRKLQNTQLKANHRKSSSLDTSSEQSSSTSAERYRCVTKYPANSRFELSLNVGDEIVLQKKRDDGWYKGELLRTGQVGLFPANFVELIGQN